jgi:signal transduction histidine kinase
MAVGSDTAEPTPISRGRSWFRRADSPLVRGVARAPVTVRTKLLVGFAGIAALLVVVGILGLLALGASSSRVQRLGTLQARAADYKGLQTDVEQLKSLLLTRREFTPNAGTPIGRGAKVDANSFFVLDATIDTTMQTFFNDSTVLEVPEPALFERVYALYSRFNRDAHTVLQQDEAGKGGTAGSLIKRELRTTLGLVPLMDGLATRTKAQADALVTANSRSFTNSRNLFVAVAGGSVILALLLGFVLSWSLVVPLRRTGGRLAEIAAGDFSRHVDVPNRDEIGVLAADVNRMNDKLGRLYTELETVSQHKSDFLANMSHELRTPLHAIIGFSEVLQAQMAGELNGKQLGYVNQVLVAGRHLLSLINDVLDLAKIEAGRMELDLAEVSMSDVLRSGVSMHSERANRARIELELRVDPAEITVNADERRIRQVVVNLVSNAIKFTPPDGRVDVSAQLRNGVVEVAVTDTGTGIALEDIDRIFEEFEQGRSEAGTQLEGTGLGLPLSRRFVELHGGRLWAESVLGAGSTFRFTLPVEQGAR